MIVCLMSGRPSRLKTSTWLAVSSRSEVDFARCEYTCTSSGSGFTVELIRNVMEVELREAQTGLSVGRETFSGDFPWDSCPESLPNCNSFRKKGSSITYNDVFVWLQRVSD